MKKLTKKQRHKIYKEAYESTRIIGICHHLQNHCGGFPNVREYFPELYFFAPKDNIGWGEHWFDNEVKHGYLKKNQEHRKTILQFCIEMTR